jgi:hypothetical protein
MLSGHGNDLGIAEWEVYPNRKAQRDVDQVPGFGSSKSVSKFI